LVGDAQGAADNALASAGEQLEAVELVGEDAASDAADSATAAAGTAAAAAAAAATNAGSAASEAAAAPKGFLENLMSGNLKWILIGLMGLFGAGLLGVLFMGRRKRKALNEHDLDDVEFLDEVDVADGNSVSGVGAAMGDQVDNVAGAAKSGVGSVAAAGGAGVAAAAAAVGFSGNNSDDETVADANMPGSEGFGEAGEVTAAEIGELDHDDTISEVDVYLAYGLHGQAEDLLTKAIDRDSDNAEYQAKLLETYAAQGNTEGYSEVASQFHQKFGSSHEAWAGISARGTELDPGNALFSGSGDEVASVGVGRLMARQSMR